MSKEFCDDQQGWIDYEISSQVDLFNKLYLHCKTNKKKFLDERFNDSHYTDGELDCMISTLNEIIEIMETN